MKNLLKKTSGRSALGVISDQPARSSIVAYVPDPDIDNIPRVEGMVFEKSFHMPHVGERKVCLATVAAFLAKCD